MDKIDKIKAEIERLKKELVWGACAAQIEMETNCKAEAYDEVLSFIATLDEPSEDLEEEIREYMSDEDNNPFDWDGRDKRDCARHFANWQKEQMMKEAVNGEVVKTLGGSLRVSSYIFKRDGFEFGDKVKLIIVKED